MDTTQLGTLIMKLGATNAKVMLNVYNEIIKKPGSPQALKALNYCVEAYKYAILTFEMVSSELVEDPQIANLGVAVIGPEIGNCEKELINAKVQAHGGLILSPHGVFGETEWCVEARLDRISNCISALINDIAPLILLLKLGKGPTDYWHCDGLKPNHLLLRKKA
ncbi:hypothetical protein Gotur_017014 [Gossypium turneri]